MKTVEEIAVEMLRTALASAHYEVMFDGVTAHDVARVAVRNIDRCPRCGAPDFVNTDCFVCEIATDLKKDIHALYTLAKWNIF